jgi:hypothetical protein
MGTQTALSLIQPTLFDYAALDRATEVAARSDAALIKGLMRRTAEDVITIGQTLLAVKDLLPHGMFLPWVSAEFDMSERAARRFMEVASAYGSKSATVADLTVKALYELSAPSTPLEVRIEIENRIEAGELVTAADIKRLKDDIAEVTQVATEKTAQLTAAEQSNLDLVANAYRIAAEESEQKYGPEIAELRQRIAVLQAAAEASVEATPGADANVLPFVPKDGGDVVTDPDVLATIEGESPDVVDIANAAFGAHAIHTALSTIDLAQTTPADFWAIFDTPYLKPKTAKWLRTATKKLNAIKKGMPK